MDVSLYLQSHSNSFPLVFMHHTYIFHCHVTDLFCLSEDKSLVHMKIGNKGNWLDLSLGDTSLSRRLSAQKGFSYCLSNFLVK